MRWPCATSAPSRCRNSWTRAASITRSSSRSPLQLTKNLNRVIDQNYYPIPEARRSNMRHRPIGIGVQGLADAFILMRYPFDSVEAKVLNREIFETIYYAALTASKDLAKEEGAVRDLRGQPREQGHPAVRHVEREAFRPLGVGHACATRSRSTACATACCWRRCPPPAPRRSSATTSASSPTPATSTRVVCSAASSSW